MRNKNEEVKRKGMTAKEKKVNKGKRKKEKKKKKENRGK